MADTNSAALPVLIEPETLAEYLSGGNVLVVDLCDTKSYAAGHIPGAVHMDNKSLIRGSAPAPGKLPEPDHLADALGKIGLTRRHHVIAYDNEGSGWAGRLLWTLDVVGHCCTSVLNGGLSGWQQAGYPLSTEAVVTTPSAYEIKLTDSPVATKARIMNRLGQPDLALLDARSPEEFSGARQRAVKSGHIPGAVNFNWTDAMDTGRNLRLLPDQTLMQMLADRGVRPEQEVIVYCHTHHRSALSYLMLKHLGFGNIRGYDGSWSEWG